jgi:hypothetical protein
MPTLAGLDGGSLLPDFMGSVEKGMDFRKKVDQRRLVPDLVKRAREGDQEAINQLVTLDPDTLRNAFTLPGLGDTTRATQETAKLKTLQAQAGQERVRLLKINANLGAALAGGPENLRVNLAKMAQGRISEDDPDFNLDEVAEMMQMATTDPEKAFARLQEESTNIGSQLSTIDQILGAGQEGGFTLGEGQQRFDAAGNLIAEGAPKSSGTGLAVDDFIGTPVRVERDGKTFLAGMVQTPDGGFEVREVGLNGELTDTSGRTAQEQIDAKTREAAVKQAVDQSGKAFDRLEGINTNIANLNEVVRLIDSGANTGVWASKLPTIRKASIELKNLQNRLGIDVIGAVTFGALSKGELDLAIDTALPTNLSEEALSQWAKTKIKAQEKLRDSIEEFASFTGSGDKTIADWIAFKKQKQNQTPSVTTQEEFDALPSGAIFIEDGQTYRKP